MSTQDTDLLGETDLAIKALAFAADLRLGTGTRYYPVSGSFEVNSNGDINVAVPSGGRQITGALVSVARQFKAPGQVDTAPPVPPASIGALIPSTLVDIIPINLNGAPGIMWYAARTSPWKSKTGTNNTPIYMGSQKVKAGYSVPVVGLAWGPV